MVSAAAVMRMKPPLSLCVGVSVSAVSIRNELSFLAGVGRLLSNRSLHVCGETERQNE